MKLILTLLTFVGLVFGQAAITTVSEKSLNTAARTKLNNNFASLLANAPNGKANLTTAGLISYVSASGVLSQAAGIKRLDVGQLELNSGTGVTQLRVQIGAGQGTTDLAQFKTDDADYGTKILADATIWTLSLKLGAGTEPACSSTTRGAIIMVQGAGGVADTVRACVKLANDSYAWTSLIFTGA